MEAFDALLPYAVQLSPWSLIGLGILSIWKGWWSPKPVVDALEKRVDSEEKAKNDALAANKILTDIILQIVSKDDTASAVLKSIRDNKAGAS